MAQPRYVSGICISLLLQLLSPKSAKVRAEVIAYWQSIGFLYYSSVRVLRLQTFPRHRNVLVNSPASFHLHLTLQWYYPRFESWLGLRHESFPS